MKNEKIKEYAFIILVWGWLPAGLFAQSNYTPNAYDILVNLWAFCVIACFSYSVIKDSFFPKNDAEELEKLKDDLFDRDVDYVFFKLKISTQANADFNKKKITGLKSKFNKLIDSSSPENVNKASENVKRFKAEHDLSDLDIRDLLAITQLQAIETLASKIPLYQGFVNVMDSKLSVGDFIFDQLMLDIKDEETTYHVFFAICYARYDSRIRKLFDRETRKIMSEVIFNEYNSVAEFATLAISFASQYPNYMKYDL